MDRLSGILEEMIRLWYGGLGQIIVGATCPLIAGPFVLSVLYFAPEWTSVLWQIVTDLRRGRARLSYMMCRCSLSVRKTVIVLRKVLARILLGKGQAYQDLEIELKEVEAASKTHCSGRIKQHSGRDPRLDRPARLWRRISVAPPYFWVLVAGLCGFISLLYVLSLEKIQEEHLLENSQGLYLSLWMVAAGLFLTLFNVLSVLEIPLAALRAKGLWVEIRQKWTNQKQEQQGKERRYWLATRSRVYDTGAIIPDKTRWRKPDLNALNQVLWEAWYNDWPWRTSFWRQIWRSIRSHLLPAKIKPPEGHYYLLNREKGRWIVQVPEGRQSSIVKVKRPSVLRTELLAQGRCKVLQEGDVITFENEQWYLLIERIYPE